MDTIKIKLLDQLQLHSSVVQRFACEYSEDGKIFILTEAGATVLTLKGDMDNIFERFKFKKDQIQLHKTNFYEHISANELKDKELFYEVLLHPELHASLPLSTPTSYPVFAMWSPRGIVEKTDCALAILTTLKNIEIYIKVTDENERTVYVRVGNFCRDMIDHNKKTGNIVTDFDEVQSQLKKDIPTTFTWSHIILKDRKACCILFVGHGDGSITVWRFNERKGIEQHEARMEYLSRYKTEIQSISALHWFCRKPDAGTLCVGDSSGRLCAVSVSKLSTNDVKFSDEVVFSMEELEKPIDKIKIITYQTTTFMIVVKDVFLLIYAISDDGDVLQSKLLKAGKSCVTGMIHYEKNILLVLSDCENLKQIELNVDGRNIVIKEKNVPLNFNFKRLRAHGLLVSPNKVFFGVLAHPYQVKDTGRSSAQTHFFVFGNTLKDPFKLLMDMTSSSLRDYWDCFETLRVTCFQDRKFPWHGLYGDENYDNMSLLKLKTLRWIAKISEKVYSSVSRVKEYNIKSYALLNYAVDIKLAVQRMTFLLDRYFSEQKLSLFQMRSLDLLNFFLKEIVAKDILTKANLGETFIDEIYNVMKIANELEYPPMPQCIWCYEPVIGSTCIPFHVDSRCAISLMPIKILPGFKCPFCKCIVSKEIKKECYPIFCPYCDVPMERKYLDNKNKKDSEASKQTMETILSNPEEMIMSDCFSDCLKENIHFNDIEENTTEYIILSDDEENEDIKNVFSEIKKIVLFESRMSEEQEDLILYTKNDEASDNSECSIEAPKESSTSVVNEIKKSTIIAADESLEASNESYEEESEQDEDENVDDYDEEFHDE